MHDNGGMPLVARRIAAGLAAVSAALHTAMLGHAGNVASTVLIAVTVLWFRSRGNARAIRRPE